MAKSVVTYEVKNRIAHITLNRPEKLNAFNVEMSYALRDAWQRFEADSDARVAILAGNGKSFSVGVDLTGADREGIKAVAIPRGLSAQRDRDIQTYRCGGTGICPWTGIHDCRDGVRYYRCL